MASIFLMFMSTLSAYITLCQKRASDPTIDGCEPPYGCWELNSRLLEEQPVLLITKPFLQLIATLIKENI